MWRYRRVDICGLPGHDRPPIPINCASGWQLTSGSKNTCGRVIVLVISPVTQSPSFQWRSVVFQDTEWVYPCDATIDISIQVEIIQNRTV